MRLLKVFLAAVSVVILPGCEPAWDVTGIWIHRSGKFYLWALDLRQTGKEISGTACSSDGVLLIQGAPVTGEFPHLTVTIGPEHRAQPWQEPGTARIEAEVVSRTSIGAQLIYATGHAVPLGFKRDEGPGCLANR